MDAEVSLLMANQALASPGKIIYDPFGESHGRSLCCEGKTDGIIL